MFKKGDKVVCVKGSACGALKQGKEYIIKGYDPDVYPRNDGGVKVLDERGEVTTWYANRFKLAENPVELVFAVGAQVERTGEGTNLLDKGMVYTVQTLYRDELGGVYKIKLQGINAIYHVRDFKVVANAPAIVPFDPKKWAPQDGEKVHVVAKDRYHARAMDEYVNDGKVYTVCRSRAYDGEFIVRLKEQDEAWEYLARTSLRPVNAGAYVPPPKPVPPPQPEDLREHLIQEQKDKGGLCSFAYEHENGLRTFHPSAPCHARLDSYGDDKGKQRTKLAYNLPHQIKNVTSLYKGKTTVEDHNYAAAWVIKDSPWAVAFLTKDIDEATKLGLFMDVEQNRYVIASACVALRSFMEFERATLFRKLMEEGHSGGASFLVACAFGKDGLGNYTRKGMGGGHDVITGSQDIHSWIKFFKEGYHTALSKTKEPFRTHHGTYRMSAACADEGGEHILTWLEKNVKGKVVGEGWNASMVINEQALFEAAAKLDQLIKGEK